jgi:vacuolar protein-sorting-associated protein 4
MYANFKDKAIDFVKEAVAADEAGEYDKAFKSYMTALEYFKTHLKYEKNPRSKEAITLKVSTWPAPAGAFAWIESVHVILLHHNTTLRL